MTKLLKSKTVLILLSVTMLVTSIFSDFSSSRVQAASSNLSFSSSSSYLVDAFNWAKATALSKVQTGVSNNIPSYQAALEDRPVFCQRDYAHQVDGAALLGLHSENFSMLKAFANLQTRARNWYSIWEVNYDGSISSIDYVNDLIFWRNLCGMFECVESGYRQYQWTNNANLLNDPTLYNFYTRTVNDFVAAHDENGNGIAEEHSSNGWLGVCSYNEGPDSVLKEAADGLGTQHQAYMAYAKILSAKGDTTGAEIWITKANALKNTFNSQSWYSESDGRYVRGKLESNEADVTNFGYESSWFILYKDLANAGVNALNYLDFIYNSFMQKPSANIEAWTYLPDVYYKWNQNSRAYSFLKHVIDSRSNYPEVSFSVVSSIATGMMGIQPDAPSNKVLTLPRLPEGNPSEVAMVDMDNIILGSHNIGVKHEGNVRTTVKNNSGSGNLNWEAQFPGMYSTLLVNGTPMAASTKIVNGTTISYVTVSVGEYQSVVVATGETPPMQLDVTNSNLIANPGFELGTTNWSFSSGTGVATNYPHGGAKLAYLDAGTTKRISQTVTVPASGNYNLFGWIAAGGTGGVFGIKVNGINRTSVNIPKNTSYNLLTMTNITLQANDLVEIYVTGATISWVNIDDFKLFQ